MLASATPPVQEMVRHGENGLLFDFFDVDNLVAQANQVLDNPDEFRHLGKAGVETIHRKYSLDACLPRMVELYEKLLP